MEEMVREKNEEGEGGGKMLTPITTNMDYGVNLK